MTSSGKNISLTEKLMAVALKVRDGQNEKVVIILGFLRKECEPGIGETFVVLSLLLLLKTKNRSQLVGKAIAFFHSGHNLDSTWCIVQKEESTSK